MTIADIRVGLRKLLLANAQIAGAVGSARIYPIVLPQGTVEPSIVLTRVSGQGDMHSEGPSGLSRPRMQIDCYAESTDDAVSLANLVKEHIDGYSGTILWGEGSPQDAVAVQGIIFDSEREGFDDASKLYRMSRDYFVWYEEA